MSSASLNPSTRPEAIDALVSGVDRYNPQNISVLEDYLYHQIRHREYDAFANLAVLKLYQFNPELYNPDVVLNILLKALCAAPLPDFNLCVALISDRPVSTDEDTEDHVPTLLPELQRLSSLLHRCRFPAFWSAYNSDALALLRDNYTVEFAGFEDAVREVALRAVRATFKRITTDRLSSYLNLQGEALDAYIAKLGWAQENGVVSIPANPDNQIQASVVRENIQFNQLQKLITHAYNA
ncbi:ARM repeat-containing protein [Exidia glandulosa HHB12029]|uniref:Eukaryotic translation initiation factor 3 subunit K n=1 Tax=Exidia glandulosa HHB12029 TaxID=1314781 RepID=A0A165PUY6_EXIGL|nr:ARM repeat-containing protein [Exidia glandulosa HHB12029]